MVAGSNPAILITKQTKQTMQKKPLLKTSLEFLKNDFPENLLPTKSYTKRQKRLFIKEIIEEKTIKTITVKKVKNLINNLHNKNIRNIGNNTKSPVAKLYRLKQKEKICFLLSPDQLKKDLFDKQIQYRRFSDFLLKLRERKKLYILYGNLSKKFFQKIYSEAHKSQGKKIENFLTLLETRLDVVLSRICFFKNIYSARQSINHNQILVNGKILNIPTYRVNPGDVISVNPKKKKIIANQMLQYIKKRIFSRRRRFLYFKYSYNLFKKHLKIVKFKKYYKLAGKFYSISPYYFNFFTSKYRKRYNLYKIRKGFSLLLVRKLNFVVRHAPINIQNQILNLIKVIYFLKNLPLYQSKLKRCLRLKRSPRHITKGMRLTPMKPLNIEASFKLLTAVVLYSPQKLVFPSLLHTDFTYSSFKPA